ncbi:MAG: hypothetical protein FJ137_04565 [Deltaproteobacteria bacterium]|nr:hypothetical protein [Deltaproteobacteria bacterium]
MATLSLFTATTAQATTGPRLGVLVVFDQLPAWELEAAAPFVGDGGFGGLDGADLDLWFDHTGTETDPGYATLATGAWPTVHGIATNPWGRAARSNTPSMTSPARCSRPPPLTWVPARATAVARRGCRCRRWPTP